LANYCPFCGKQRQGDSTAPTAPRSENRQLQRRHDPVSSVTSSSANPINLKTKSSALRRGSAFFTGAK
jgi:hypothetical protein